MKGKPQYKESISKETVFPEYKAKEATAGRVELESPSNITLNTISDDSACGAFISWNDKRILLSSELYKAIKENNASKVKEIYNRVDVNDYSIINANEDVLHFAIEEGDLDILECFVEEGTYINSLNRFFGDSTPLHTAVSCGRFEIVKYLIEKGADPYLKDADQRTPLHIAAENGEIDIIRYFIEEKKLEVDMRGGFGNTPLHSAAMNGRYEVVEYLINQGANVSIREEEYLNAPLHSSLINADLGEFNPINEESEEDARTKVVDLLLSKGADVNARNDEGNTPLHLAAKCGYDEAVKVILSKGAEVNAINSENDTPLHLAISIHSVEVTRILITSGASLIIEGDVEVNRRSPIDIIEEMIEKSYETLLSEEEKIASTYITKDARNSNNTGQTSKDIKYPSLHLEVSAEDPLELLEEASRKVEFEFAKIIKEELPNIIIKSIKLASYKKFQDYLVPLIRTYIDQNIIASDLHDNILEAIKEKSHDYESQWLEICRICHMPKAGKQDEQSELLKLPRDILKHIGSFINISDIKPSLEHNDTEASIPETMTAKFFSEELPKADEDKASTSLKEALAYKPLNTSSNNQSFSLHLAVREGSYTKAESLIHGEAEINQRNEEGETSLHIAVNNGDIKLIKHLLDNNADPFLKDSYGRTSLHLACSYFKGFTPNPDIVKLLISSAGDKARLLVNEIDEDGDTALCNAVWIPGNLSNEIVKLLLDSGANPNIGKFKPLANCIAHGLDVNSENINNKNIELLLEHEADYQESDKIVGNALHLAASRGYIAAAELLINKSLHDKSLVSTISPCYDTLYKGGSIKDIALDERNFNRTESFINWYHKQEDSLKELAGNFYTEEKC
ncbi:MAG: alpha-latroinsectotoxin-Lt1a-like isoform [Rickettsiaceae bacterium]|jgi:ankyrin repeat protein|nr:alpha-latroinsectotoxin-Lt1a-like isoform [Rickettsiaceae bacterium]